MLALCIVKAVTTLEIMLTLSKVKPPGSLLSCLWYVCCVEAELCWPCTII